MVADKYVHWLIWKLSRRLRFPLFKTKINPVLEKIRKNLSSKDVLNTLQYVETSHQNARSHIRPQQNPTSRPSGEYPNEHTCGGNFFILALKHPTLSYPSKP